MMVKKQKEAEFRFYEELDDFLPKEKKKKAIVYQFTGNPSIKDAIEACGVPHPEVEIILINGISMGFDYHLQDGDRVAVYPVFESLDISPLIKLRDKPLRTIKFIVDVNLGKLARSLRMLGFDSLYDHTYSDQEIVRISSQDRRIILTRDQNLLKHRAVTHGYWLRNTEPTEQLKEVIRRLDLLSTITPFSRCMECNGQLTSIDKEDIIDLLPPRTAKYYTEFYRCMSCNKLYWPGSHYQKMQRKIDQLRKSMSELSSP
jgi:uncharacterized protein with PIN domain